MNDGQYFEKTLTPTFASKSSEIFVGGCQRSSENIDIHRFSFLQWKLFSSKTSCARVSKLLEKWENWRDMVIILTAYNLRVNMQLFREHRSVC